MAPTTVMTISSKTLSCHTQHEEISCFDKNYAPQGAAALQSRDAPSCRLGADIELSLEWHQAHRMTIDYDDQILSASSPQDLRCRFRQIWSSCPQRGSSAKPNSQFSVPPVTGCHRTARDQQHANSHPLNSRIEARPFCGAGMAAFPVISTAS